MNKETADTITNLSKHLLIRPQIEFDNELYIESVKLFIDIARTLSNDFIDNETSYSNNTLVKEKSTGSQDEI
jgi:hypothetical protein